MLGRPRVEISVDRRRPEQIRILLGPPEASVLIRTCATSEDVFEYLWLVLRVPPELAAARTRSAVAGRRASVAITSRVPGFRFPIPDSRSS
ncbi:MAG: hypothetical protein LC780_12605 [Acidobacteria bacterium]|nr:hypothetical protein [Acidobacteriota bacterium]